MPTSAIHQKRLNGRARAGILGPGDVRKRGMMRFRHIGRCAGAVMLIAVALLPAGGSPAQTPPVAPSAESDQPALESAVGAFITARKWLDTFALPPLDDPASLHTLPDCPGMLLALRGGGGRLISDVAEIAHTQPGRLKPADDPMLLRRALGRALSSALSDSAIKNLPNDVRATVGGDLSVELELAGPLRPMLARTAAQVNSQYEPGVHGLAMRRGEKLAMQFPAQMRRTGTVDNIDAVIARLAGDVGLTPSSIEQLFKRNEITLYRFETLHLVQDTPRTRPRPTHRGLRLIGVEEVTTEAVARFADAVAEHLLHQRWPGVEPLGLRGDYDPLREQYFPLVAPPRDQALTAMALLRYAEAPAVNGQIAAAARRGAHDLLHALAVVDAGENNPFTDPSACAMIVCAVAEVSPAERDDELNNLLQRALDPLARLIMLDDPALAAEIGVLSASERGMIALAVVRACASDPQAGHCAMTRRYIDLLWNTADDDAIVAHLPWLGWAELEDTALAGVHSTRQSVMQRVRLALWNKQLKSPAAPATLGGSNNQFWFDLLGGFQLSADAGGAPDRPTSQSARPAALLATLLRNVQLTPESMRSAAMQSHRLTMRFLMQLQVTDDDQWFFRNTPAALGGIRRSAWQNSQPNAAAALALITAAETLISHEQLPVTAGTGVSAPVAVEAQ